MTTAPQHPPDHDAGALPPGPIDIHSHLLPGVDDGCQSFEDSLACIARLKQAGFVGTVCTPHMWPGDLPMNTPSQVRAWVSQFRQQLRDTGVDYPVWAGGELRLSENVIDWMVAQGVPTLADSRCVMVDYWGERWPDWADDVFRWLRGRGYQPILAHPERLPCARQLDDVLARLQQQGVWLQGNFRCMTGEDGYVADQTVRRLLAEGRYRFMALDMHGPDSLEGRLDGMALVEAEFNRDLLDTLTVEAPRRYIVRQN